MVQEGTIGFAFDRRFSMAVNVLHFKDVTWLSMNVSGQNTVEVLLNDLCLFI